MGFDIHDYDNKIKHEFDMIKASLPIDRQKLVFEFDERYSIKMGLSKARRLIILNKLKLIAQTVKKPLNELEPKDIEDFELALIKKGLSKRSQKDYRILLKQFYRWLDNEEGKRWDWIQKSFKNHKVPDKTHKPEDFMDENEAQIFLYAATTTFERALAAMFLFSGCRASEVGTLTVGSLQFVDDCVIATVFGKTGERRIKLYNPTSGYLKAWISEHPQRQNKDAPLWIYRGDHYSYNGLAKILKNLGSRAGIKKPLNPHSFRHRLYTCYQLKGAPQAIREAFFGHVHGSRMSRIYTHTSDQDVFNYLDMLHGKGERKYRDVKLELEMKQCAKCLKTYLPHEAFCSTCGVSLEKSVLQQQELVKEKEKLAERVLMLEEKLGQVLQVLQKEREKN